MATFDTSERPIQPKKRMLAIPFTYEHLREVEFIDKAMEHVEEIGVQRIMAKVDEGLETMFHGAGGDGPRWHDRSASGIGFNGDGHHDPESVARAPEKVQTVLPADLCDRV